MWQSAHCRSTAARGRARAHCPAAPRRLASSFAWLEVAAAAWPPLTEVAGTVTAVLLRVLRALRVPPSLPACPTHSSRAALPPARGRGGAFALFRVIPSRHAVTLQSSAIALRLSPPGPLLCSPRQQRRTRLTSCLPGPLAVCAEPAPVAAPTPPGKWLS